MGKSYRKFAPNTSPIPHFYFSKQPKTTIASRKLILKSDILKGYYQNCLQELTLFFLLKPVPCNGQSYQKQNWAGTSD